MIKYMRTAGVFLLALWPLQSFAQDGRTRAVEVYATTQASPPQITLHWNISPYTVEVHKVFRRAPGASTWVYLGNDPAPSATSFVDTNVQVGERYEYKVYREYFFAEMSFHARGYTIAGIDAPLLDQRGTVILVIDSSKQAALAAEIARFQQDLAGDGWNVLTETVAPSDTPASVRAKLQTLYNADPTGVKAAILLGRIPVPYSGDINPDGHSEHRGAWAADTYYADLNGAWTDSTVNRTSANQSRNHNIPGDGKFDQSKLPSDADIAIGRIDMANMSGFGGGSNETELLRNYLRKNHEFRHQLGAYSDVPRRGLIRDGFGSLSGESPASVAWRGFTAMFGPSNVTTSANWFPTLENNKYLWAYGSGPGSYTSAGSVGSSTDFKTKNSLAVFNILFGSYFGDWDSPTDNFLRAPLAGAADSLGLVSTWGNRADWQIHGMTLGETIGDAYLRTVNNPSDWSPDWDTGYFTRSSTFARMVHMALMGDPTLRLHPISSPESGTVTRTPGGTTDSVQLTWTAVSEPNLIGYHIYRSADPFGGFTRLTTTPTTNLSYTDASAPQSKVYYQVRAVATTSSASGTYLNAGQALHYSVPLATPAIAPMNFNATALSDSTIELTWTSNDPDADVFIIERRLDGETEWAEIAELDGVLRNYQDTGLIVGTGYEYRIFAANSLGQSPASTTATATTLASTVIVFDPFADGGVTNGADPLDANWSKTGNTFEVVQDAALDPVAPHNVAEFFISTSNKDEYLAFALPSEVQLAVGETLRVSFKLRHTGTSRNDATSTGVSLAHTPSNSPWNNAANKEYWLRTSYGADGTLGSIRKTLAQQILNAGTILQDGTVSIDAGTNVLTVSLEATRTAADQMRIRYQLDGGPVQEAFDNSDVITAFNRVFLRFRTRNDAENPGEPRFRLDDVTVETVPPPPVPPAAVTDIQVASLSSTSLAITWTEVPTATGYVIERSPSGNAGTWTTLDANLPAEPTTYTDTALASGTTYHYRIAASNTYGTSDWATASGSTEAVLDYALVIPESVSEGASSFQASVTRTVTTANQVVILSTTSDRLTIPDSVTIPDGQSSVNFTVTVADDAIINPNDLATITAFAPAAIIGESFNGPVNAAVNTQDTGWGWGGSWYSNNTPAVLVEPALSYTKNGTINNAGTRAIRLNSSGGSDARRNFATKYTSGDVWVSTLLHRNSGNWGTQMILSENTGGGINASVKYENNTNYWRLVTSTGANEPLLASNPSAQVHYIVMHFDFTARQIHAWLSPDVSGSTPTNALGSATVPMPEALTGISRLDLFGYSTLDGFDEVRVATSFANLHGGTTFASQLQIIDNDDSPSLTPQQQWLLDNFGTTEPTGDAAPNADPDGDGILNLIEYALANGDPLTPGSANLPQVGTTTIAENDYLTLTIAKNPNATDVTYIVETSTDLSTWQSGEGNTVIVSETASELIVRTAAPVDNESRRFLRLRVLMQ